MNRDGRQQMGKLGKRAGFCIVGLLVGAGGCIFGLTNGSGASVVLYVITNDSGSAITYDLTMGEVVQEDQSLEDDKQVNLLVMCGELAEFRMNMVCADGGTDCNILGIIIEANEVECGDIVEVVVEAAQDGMLFLSATRRQEASADDEDDGGSAEKSGDAAG